jgi:dynein heavy chain, axonemal
MCVPDFELICEIMLVAEGFQEVRLLAKKFITLYTLCKELLSKQDHYDWGLRAIKSVLVVAGSLKVLLHFLTNFIHFNHNNF